MSTRSYIVKENQDGTYTGIYCHSDGYLSYNGVMLLNYYQDREKVEKLISLGHMSSLHEKVDPDPTKPHSFNYDERQGDVCVFYGRDRGEKGQEAHQVALESIDDPESWISYCYVYGLDNKWKFFRCGELKEGLKDLQEAVDKEVYNKENVSEL